MGLKGLKQSGTGLTAVSFIETQYFFRPITCDDFIVAVVTGRKMSL